MAKIKFKQKKSKFIIYLKTILGSLLVWFVVFSIIGIIVSLPLGKGKSPSFISKEAEHIPSNFYFTLLSKELKPLQIHFNQALPDITFSDFVLQLTTQLNRTDIRTLFGNELPGFYPYQNRIIIGQAETNYSNLPVESALPLEIILEYRHVIDSPEEVEKSKPNGEIKDATVFIYNTHNRESFLPHLDNVSDPSSAFHSELNVSLISEELKKSLADYGIGSLVDQTDFSQVLHDKGWDYWQSYQASRPIVEEVVNQNKQVNYIFDIHRDSRRKDDTTVTINAQDYAQLFFVIGADFEENEKNAQLATALHQQLDEAYPGISRGVAEMGGSGRNGVYNQDISANAILIEFGGVDNTLEELYRTVAAFAQVLSEYYWDAEQVIINLTESKYIFIVKFFI